MEPCVLTSGAEARGGDRAEAIPVRAWEKALQKKAPPASWRLDGSERPNQTPTTTPQESASSLCLTGAEAHGSLSWVVFVPI